MNGSWKFWVLTGAFESMFHVARALIQKTHLKWVSNILLGKIRAKVLGLHLNWYVDPQP